MNLRLSQELLETIDSCRSLRAGKVSRNTWIAEAIQEKLAQEVVNQSKVEQIKLKLPVKHKFYEFFAGGGMARAGLGKNWECLFANDFDPMKAASYNSNWGSDHFLLEDVSKVRTVTIPDTADLAWASFPCQDLSLAGGGSGLRGNRSGTFWSFLKIIENLIKENRGPKLIVLENVCGTLTSHGGQDFAAICDALSLNGYKFGALVIDAVHFLPQSRPRLFIIAASKDVYLPKKLLQEEHNKSIWHPGNLLSAYKHLSEESKNSWVWWKLPEPPGRNQTLIDLIENEPTGVSWHSIEETTRLIEMMSHVNREKVESAKKLKSRIVGTIYRRTRIEKGERIQRAEIRFDDIAGCLRTPAGGSSRQIIMIVEGDKIRSRLLSPREAARLMGLPDQYVLPKNYNDAYHLVGDGLAVPVVKFLAENILEPLLQGQVLGKREVA